MNNSSNMYQLISSKYTTMTIDWLSITMKPKKPSAQWQSVYLMPQISQSGKPKKSKGNNGYDLAYSYPIGVKILMNSKRLDMGVHIMFDGTTLKKIEELYQISGYEIIEWYNSEFVHFSRIDIALDAFNYGCNAEHFSKQCEENKQSNKRTPITFIKNHKQTGDTLYIGSIKSRRKLLRIYDKGLQTGLHDDWTRFELQLSSGYGNQFVKALHDTSNPNTLEKRAKAAKGAIKAWCDFPDDKIFQEIFNEAELTLENIHSTNSDTENWLLTIVAKSLAKTCINNDKFLSDFMLAYREFKLEIEHEDYQ